MMDEGGCGGGRAGYSGRRVRPWAISSRKARRGKWREAQARANEERAQRDRANVDDMATFLVARTRLASVDEWQAERVAQIGLDADRRRDEHRSEGAAAVARIKGRGESIATIAALATISESEVRSYLKAASAAARAQSVGAAASALSEPLGGGASAEDLGDEPEPRGGAGEVDAPAV